MVCFLTKEDAIKQYELTKQLIESGKIMKNDINQIALDRMKEYIDRFDDVQKIQIKVIELIDFINKFGSHNRSTLLHTSIYTLFQHIPIDPNQRIGILESIKWYIYYYAEQGELGGVPSYMTK